MSALLDDDATQVLGAAAPRPGPGDEPKQDGVQDPDLTRQTGTAVPAPLADDNDRTVLRPAGDAGASVSAPVAGAASDTHRKATHLPPGFKLHEYRIDTVLGQGGFGITYLATDVHLNAQVAIKEFLPDEIARRGENGQVGARSPQLIDSYRQGLDNFLAEARTLASFRHPAIVRVARFFEANLTAYMVLEYEQGTPLRRWWPAHSPLGQAAGSAEGSASTPVDEATLVELLWPLLDGLATVHAAGFLHRDIKPDNIQVRQHDGSLVLLDFGSAGQTLAGVRDPTVVVTPGYAPIEQYGLGEQGPWTDIYAFAATLYWAITGAKPADAQTRAFDPEAMVSAAKAGSDHYGQAFLAAIDAALDPDPKRRPRSVAEFRRALCADHLATLNLQEALLRDAENHSDASRRGDTAAAQPSAEEDGAPGAPQGLNTPRSATRGGRLLALRNPAKWRRPRDWPLSAKMIGAMLATALLPMLLVGAYNLNGSVQAVARAELQSVRQLAHSTAGRLGQFVQDGRHMTLAMSGDPALAAFLQQPDAAALPALRERLVRWTAADPDVQLVMLMDKGGTAVVASDAQVMGRNFRFREYFQQALQGRSHTTGLVVGAVAGASGFFVAEPVRSAQGEVVGVLTLRILGASVARILGEVSQGSTLTPMLIDADGVVVHHPKSELLYSSLAPLPQEALDRIRADQRFRRDTVHSLDELPLAKAMVGAKSVGDVSWRSTVTGVDQIAGFAPVPGQPWVVGVLQTRATFEAPLIRLQQQMWWSAGLVGLLFTGLALMFARSIVRPVRALTAAADALKAGVQDAAKVKVESRDEIGQLSRTFNVMIDALRQRERDNKRARSTAVVADVRPLSPGENSAPTEGPTTSRA